MIFLRVLLALPNPWVQQILMRFGFPISASEEMLMPRISLSKEILWH